MRIENEHSLLYDAFYCLFNNFSPKLGKVIIGEYSPRQSQGE